MKKILALLGLSLAIGLGGCSEKKATEQNTQNAEGASSDKVYRVAMNAAFAPFQWVRTDGKIIGFEIDLVDAMAKEGNFKVEYVNTPWDTLFATLPSGDNDILSSAITITEDRKQAMDFSEPYFEIKQVILVPKGKNVQSIEDIKNLNKVAVTTGTSADAVAQKTLGKTSNKIARFESLPLVLKEVENGGADVAISDSAVVSNYIKNNSDKGFTIVQIQDSAPEFYGMAVRKGDTETLKMVNEALAKVKASGEYDKIYNQYFAQ
ncbi:basic amino acid ABC transporter substrate-binding protein [Neisseria sp. Ec49-e6-T10]